MGQVEEPEQGLNLLCSPPTPTQHDSHAFVANWKESCSGWKKVVLLHSNQWDPDPRHIPHLGPSEMIDLLLWHDGSVVLLFVIKYGDNMTMDVVVMALKTIFHFSSPLGDSVQSDVWWFVCRINSGDVDFVNYLLVRAPCILLYKQSIKGWVSVWLHSTKTAHPIDSKLGKCVADDLRMCMFALQTVAKDVWDVQYQKQNLVILNWVLLLLPVRAKTRTGPLQPTLWS